MAKRIIKQVFALVLLSFLSSNDAINRPVYKVSLSQKGYTQFLQYDVEIPPIREFTFCSWIRFLHFNADQSLFTYVVDGNTRIIRLWLKKGGRIFKMAVQEKTLSDIPVNFTENIWHHICYSYQSDYGAWALYVDGRIEYCETSEDLKNYILPGGGSIVVGYGLSEDGTSTGFEGQIFGVNMLLRSTIIRNHTIELDSRNQQKLFRKNKIKKGIEDIEYIILNNLKQDDLYYFGRFEATRAPVRVLNSKTRKLRKLPKTASEEFSRESLIFGFDDQKKKLTTSDQAKIQIWNLINKAGQQGNFKQNKKEDISGSGTQDLPTLSVFETPPPSESSSLNFYDAVFESEKQPAQPQPFSHSMDKLPLQQKPIKLDISSFQHKNKVTNMMKFQKQSDDLLDIETPPPPQKNNEVYGQWTSSKFSSSVLDYLKNINFQYKKPSKPPSISLVPPTIPLIQTSDSFPYASNTYLSKVRSNRPLKIHRRSFVEKIISPTKREANLNKNINVQILENDLRSSILKLHAETRPKYVEVTNRGSVKGSYRHYRNVDNQEDSEEDKKNTDIDIMSYIEDPNIGNHKLLPDYDEYKNNNLVSILPFIKSLEYFIQSNDEFPTKSSEWNNIKMYNRDQPRKITLETVEALNSKIKDEHLKATKSKIYERSPLTIVYNDIKGRLESTLTNGSLKSDREIAKNVANKSDLNQPVSIFKYNHGYLPGHKGKKNNHKEKLQRANSLNETIINFNKHVKIGNALNELPVIGSTNRDKKRSFIGGDETIPDINRYRSDIDNNYTSKDIVPPSLPAAVCKNMDVMNDEVELYVQNDGSIDAINWQSPIRKKSIAIDFIQINYKKCSYVESNLEDDPLLLINWNRTPVRLFGGAFPLRTKDLCGFF